MSAVTPSLANDVARPVPRRQVVSWAFWDWGQAAFQAVILTFVFSVYLTEAVGDDLPGETSATTWFSWSIGIAGVVVAVLAPVTGQRADASGHRKRSLGIWSALTIVATAGLFFVENDYHFLALGLILLAVASVCSEFATVSYYAMLRQVSTPETIGRVSGFGWAMGYFGGIVLLLVCYTGFIAGDGDTRGFLGISTEGGLNIRLIAIFAAVWFAIFALPVLFQVPEVPATPGRAKVSFFGSYRVLWHDLRALYQTNRNAVYFLGASALYRDGLNAIFAFGAVLANTVYGIATADVLLFGIAANVVSAVGALVAGRFDDRVGPKRVVLVSLIGMLIAGTIVLFLSGPMAFWIFGLILALFVGPAQSSSRTYLARMAPPGREGEMFGLYATTGRAVSFLSPLLFGVFIAIFDADRAGIVGILLILLVGLLVLIPVKPPRDSISGKVAGSV
jgi:UMF1 family MFS transporter